MDTSRRFREVRRVAARDGAPLTYRLYPGRADRVVVLVHGSSGASISMHASAQALQAAGATVYAISLRGHGGSGTVNGDISYRDQLDDDLVDFIKAVGLADPKIHRTLVGFSSGGGFVLRIAERPAARAVRCLSRGVALHRAGLARRCGPTPAAGRAWRCRG